MFIIVYISFALAFLFALWTFFDRISTNLYSYYSIYGKRPMHITRIKIFDYTTHIEHINSTNNFIQKRLVSHKDRAENYLFVPKKSKASFDEIFFNIRIAIRVENEQWVYIVTDFSFKYFCLLFLLTIFLFIPIAIFQGNINFSLYAWLYLLIFLLVNSGVAFIFVKRMNKSEKKLQKKYIKLFQNS